MRFLLLILSFSPAMAVEWVERNCWELSEFPQTWGYIKQMAPYVGDVVADIAELSGDTEIRSSTGYTVNMDKCWLTIPFENGTSVDGIRTLVTYKVWKKDGYENAGGVLVEYSFKKDASTGAISRHFISAAVCRGRKSCERRGIIKKIVTPEPTEPQPQQPIILEPSPRKEPEEPASRVRR